MEIKDVEDRFDRNYFICHWFLKRRHENIAGKSEACIALELLAYDFLKKNRCDVCNVRNCRLDIEQEKCIRDFISKYLKEAIKIRTLV